MNRGRIPLLSLNELEEKLVNLTSLGIVKWGKEQPKITNLACTPQP